MRFHFDLNTTCGLTKQEKRWFIHRIHKYKGVIQVQTPKMIQKTTDVIKERADWRKKTNTLYVIINTSEQKQIELSPFLEEKK